jgi:hypothetical protein
MNPSRRNERIHASNDEFGMTSADQAAVGPLENLPPEACPLELAERTIRRLCAMAQEAQASAPTPTPCLDLHHLKDFWLCLSNNILVT